MMRGIFIVFFSYLFMYNSCNKRINCRDILYSFQTNIKAFPDLDSLNINDTIWLEFSCSTQLADLNSGQSIDYSGAENFGTAIGIFEFTGGSVNNPGGTGAVDAFEYKLIHGVFIPDSHLPNENKDYEFAEIGSEYKFKLGIIPKRHGIYTISPGDAANVYTKKNKCDKAGFAIKFTNTNQHLYFYEQNRPGYTPSEYERTHMYCFKVK
jgi:hypothetical protein